MDTDYQVFVSLVSFSSFMYVFIHLPFHIFQCMGKKKKKKQTKKKTDQDNKKKHTTTTTITKTPLQGCWCGDLDDCILDDSCPTCLMPRCRRHHNDCRCVTCGPRDSLLYPPGTHNTHDTTYAVVYKRVSKSSHTHSDIFPSLVTCFERMLLLL